MFRLEFLVYQVHEKTSRPSAGQKNDQAERHFRFENILLLAGLNM